MGKIDRKIVLLLSVLVSFSVLPGISIAQVVINEFSSDGTGEWAELYNSGDDAKDISGWKIDDSDVDVGDPFIIPENTIIESGEFLLFEDLPIPLNDDGDTIQLFDSTDSLIDSISYGVGGDVEAPSAGASAGRLSDGSLSLFVFTVSTPASSNGAVVFVDSSGVCEDNSPCFWTVQEGIDNAAEGGTVNVSAGEYYESISIQKKVELVGDPGDENPGPDNNAPLIYGDCSGRVLTIAANGVVVEGFVIQDGSNCYPVVQINPETSGVIIQENEISYGYRGVTLTPTSNGNQILNNVIYGNDVGIRIGGSTDNLIQSNEIYENNYGIELTEAGGGGGLGVDPSGNVTGNQITSNTFYNNEYGIYGQSNIIFLELLFDDNQINYSYSAGIYFSGGSESSNTLTISNNVIGNNGGYGAYLFGDSGIYDSVVTLDGNNIIDNSYEGIYIGYVNSGSTVDILNNTITGNGGDGELAGIYVYSIYDSTLTTQSNTVSNNYGYGIEVQDVGDSSIMKLSDNNVSYNGNTGIQFYGITTSTLEVNGNEILSNSYSGIEIASIVGEYVIEEDGTETYIPSNATLSSNSIEGNIGHGVYLCGNSCQNSKLTITHNDIHDNSYQGVQLYSLTSTAVTFDNNTVSGNGLNGLDGAYSGVELNYLVQRSYLTMGNNNISSNGYYGIYMQNIIVDEDRSSNVTIGIGNTISWNANAGIYLESSITNTIIKGNNITNNGVGGEEGFTGIVVNYALGNEAHENIISGNGEVGVQNNDETNAFNATLNYWGSITGPGHPLLNPAGLGNNATDNVLFVPYYLDSGLSTILAENQVLLGETTSVDEDNKEIIIPDDNVESDITVPSGVEDSTLNLALLMTTIGEIKNVTLEGDIDINVATSIGTVIVDMPPQISISGNTSWNGTLMLPTIKPITSVSPTPSAGNVISSVDAVIEVGFGDVPLTFNKGVRLVIPGQSGKSAGYSRGGIFTSITTVCSADSQVTGDSLPDGGDCKINAGSNLVIWTKHFTSFVTYTESAPSSGDGSSPTPPPSGGYSPFGSLGTSPGIEISGQTSIEQIIGTSSTYQVQVKNTGTGSGTYALSISDIPSGWYTLSGPITIDAGATENMQYTLNLPSDASDSTFTVRVNVAAIFDSYKVFLNVISPAPIAESTTPEVVTNVNTENIPAPLPTAANPITGLVTAVGGNPTYQTVIMGILVIAALVGMRFMSGNKKPWKTKY